MTSITNRAKWSGGDRLIERGFVSGGFEVTTAKTCETVSPAATWVEFLFEGSSRSPWLS